MKFISSFLSLLLAIATSSLAEDTINGFKFTDLKIERDDIKGVLPRDAIPSIDKPIYIAPGKADFMKDDDLVLSFTLGETTRAYPLRILVWHEIVNETIAEKPILVTYCPLCGTAMIFDRKIGGKVRSFGVSGMLYQSDVLMFDREDESLWSQLKMSAVSGALAGTELKLLPSEHLTWKAWKEKYPKGEVLSTDTGHPRDYSERAYAEYFDSPDARFPFPKKREDLPDKDWVIGVIADGKAIAFSVSGLEKKKEATKDEITVKYDAASRLAVTTDKDGKVIPNVTVFWFAWQAFNPQTAVWKP